MELMQKYAKADGAVGVDDLRRWPSDSLAVEFLSETTSATSAERLLKASDGPQISSWALGNEKSPRAGRCDFDCPIQGLQVAAKLEGGFVG
ncbi:hypothetical protein HRR83_002601 [Exophiala dermatitidis]|uniref:Uncharacterized protein n=1 Tax=Exophiala dermatitidis TaxID=5970 RepID=A0AAN6ELC4_EXODE|nr:hypothetical protein HRR73_005543 [Exophiala dermatitidis]KAJ4519901.1 hypothetical protein HRR75_001762 [Exophiala dermatitidis]KAJ4523717.1 hypothetical protein HRR74_001910 [Exophiala dermatitidis]KAJ4537344.1 hypothetical protein HRR76_005355 [Exophiala dermatitidis]KAJ4555058.1 hypothetical protein HRR77_001002 [Exophiala dermatitidis]